MKRALARTTVTTLVAVLASMLLLNMFVMCVNAQVETVVEINPRPPLTIGEEDVPLPTEPCTINITVIDVIDLWNWQIKLYFDPTILNCTTAWYPADNVFAGQTTVPIEPVIDDVEGYVLFGCCLMGGAPGVDVDRGTLCQINFTGIASGSSDLNFSTPLGVDTFLWDSYLDDIEFTISNGEIIVIPEFPTLAVVPLLIISTLVSVLIAKRKWPNSP